MPHEKLPSRAAYFVYVKEKLIFFHDHHAPWFQRKRAKSVSGSEAK